LLFYVGTVAFFNDWLFHYCLQVCSGWRSSVGPNTYNLPHSLHASIIFALQFPSL
jgi:hypothetical protein